MAERTQARAATGRHRALVHLVALAPPAALAAWAALGALPATADLLLMRWSGLLALLLVLAALACTPLTTLSGWRGWGQIRRPLGVYGCLYAVAHLGIYASRDAGWDLELLLRDLGERRAMLAGMAGLLLLLPLAITSTDGWQRQLGGWWRRLHTLVYPAVGLSVAHYLLLERDERAGALAAGAALAALLLLRIPPLRRALTRWRQGRQRAG